MQGDGPSPPASRRSAKTATDLSGGLGTTSIVRKGETLTQTGSTTYPDGSPQADAMTGATKEGKKRMIRIISGGQTGADQAALDAAIALDLPHGGWLAKGRKTENGPLPARYRLMELDSGRYRDRTEHNVLAADATLICSFGPLTGGSALTEALAIRHNRLFLHIDFEHHSQDRAILAVQEWLLAHPIATLNVAGPRASSEPRIYQAVHDLLMAVDWHR